MSVPSQFRCLVLGFTVWCCTACSTLASRHAAPDDAASASDAQTQARVKVALAHDPGLSGRVIEVWVEGGVAHLRGFVESSGDLKLAVVDAKSVPSVVNIINPSTRPAIIDQAFLKSHPNFVPDWTLTGALG